ncbi:MAG: 3-deoxy-8-phosphooctulonate synthase [Armatimonadetes bacterium]|nr:3-deoxy-8-phosphooctulonate synthase [Armatimonadota bacterium]
MTPVAIVDGVELGGDRLALLAGPCLVEDVDITTDIALRLQDICGEIGMPFVFKASYDKANRTSIQSERGPGWREGLEILARVKERAQVPLVSDVHETAQVAEAAQVCDILQVPAFLCRQTDLLVAVGESGKAVNVKKGQFVAPADMRHSLEKVLHTGNRRVSVTERGYAFGYNNLVVDMRGIPIMRDFGYPVIFDGTHSVQLPSGSGCASGGQREFVAPLVKAAVAAGANALFLETHPTPDSAPCDGPNMVPLGSLKALLVIAQRLFEIVNE